MIIPFFEDFQGAQSFLKSRNLIVLQRILLPPLSSSSLSSEGQAILLQLPKIGKGKYFNLDAEPKLQVLERSHKVPTLFHILQQISS